MLATGTVYICIKRREAACCDNAGLCVRWSLSCGFAHAVFDDYRGSCPVNKSIDSFSHPSSARHYYYSLSLFHSLLLSLPLSLSPLIFIASVIVSIIQADDAYRNSKRRRSQGGPPTSAISYIALLRRKRTSKHTHTHDLRITFVISTSCQFPTFRLLLSFLFILLPTRCHFLPLFSVHPCFHRLPNVTTSTNLALPRPIHLKAHWLTQCMDLGFIFSQFFLSASR